MFDKINNILPQINQKRKRIISIKYIIHRLFIKWDIDFEIKLTKYNKTLKYYEEHWKKIQALIGDKLNF